MQDNKHLLNSICFWNLSHGFISLTHNYLSNKARQWHAAKSSALLFLHSQWRKKNIASANVWNNSVSSAMISDNTWFIPAADCGGLCRKIKCHFSLMCHVSSVLLWQNSDSRVIERELNIDTDIVTGERWVHSSSIDSSTVAFPLEAIDTSAGTSSTTRKNFTNNWWNPSSLTRKVHSNAPSNAVE